MRRVFADTYYWIALLNDRDQGHATAQVVGAALRPVRFVTTHEILTELLTYFSGHGKYMRQTATTFVRDILGNPAILVLPQSEQSFLDGLALYESRPDKVYSLTDCISMVAMRREAIVEVLTDDNHFTQEGFFKLL